MIYNLLKRIQNLLASKPSGTKEEQEILSLVSQALPAMLNGHDTETLAANEPAGTDMPRHQTAGPRMP